jgi:hypothetical protein
MAVHPVGDLAGHPPVVDAVTVAAPPMILTWFPVLLEGHACKPRMRHSIMNMVIIIEVFDVRQW